MELSIDHSNKGKSRLWTRDFSIILCISLLASITVQSLNNGTPLYIDRLGGPTAYAGLLILVFSFVAGITRVIAGGFIDRKGRKLIMLVGAVLLLVGTYGACLLPGVGPQLGLRAFQGIGFSLVTTAAPTAAADVLPKDRMGEGIGYYSLGQSLGLVVGPALGITLSSFPYAESLFVGAGVVVTILTVLISLCTYEHHPERLPETSACRMRWERLARGGEEPGRPDEPKGQSPRYSGLSAVFEKRALVGAIPMVVVSLGYSVPMSFMALYAQGLHYANISYFFVVAAISMTLVRFAGGSFFDRVSPRKLYLFSTAFGVTMFIMAYVALNPLMLIVSGAFHGLAMGIANPLLNSIAIKNTPPERWGAANALFYLANDLGVGSGAFIWGAVADVAGFRLVMLGGAGMVLLSWILAMILFPRANRA